MENDQMHYYESRNRFQIMSYDQVLRLTKLLNDKSNVFNYISKIIDSIQVPQVSLTKLISEIQECLKDENILIKDIRLIGGAASYIIDPSSTTYSDIDLLFSLSSCSSMQEMDQVRRAVLKAIRKCCYKYTSQPAECLVTKQVCVQNPISHQYWSLFSLGYPSSSTNHIHKTHLHQSNETSPVIELKFTGEVVNDNSTNNNNNSSNSNNSSTSHSYTNHNSDQRHYECSVDSFQIILDPLMHFLNNYSTNKITLDFYPMTVIECIWGCIKTALSHLANRIIYIDKPEQIRGGGLLKYCKLVVNDYQLDRQLDDVAIKKYMCARFFIDFPLMKQQHQKIVNYLYSHFPKDLQLHIEFLQQLAEVIFGCSNYMDVTKIGMNLLIQNLIIEKWNEAANQRWEEEMSMALLKESNNNVDNTCYFQQFGDPHKWSVGEIIIFNKSNSRTYNNKNNNNNNNNNSNKNEDDNDDDIDIDNICEAEYDDCNKANDSGINSSTHTIASPVISDNDLEDYLDCDDEDDDEDGDEVAEKDSDTSNGDKDGIDPLSSLYFLDKISLKHNQSLVGKDIIKSPLLTSPSSALPSSSSIPSTLLYVTNDLCYYTSSCSSEISTPSDVSAEI